MQGKASESGIRLGEIADESGCGGEADHRAEGFEDGEKDPRR
jgi:hypothetical protein